MAVGFGYFYGLGLSIPVYLYNITNSSFLTECGGEYAVLEIGTLPSSSYKDTSIGYLSDAEIGLSSSNTEYIPITGIIITGATVNVSGSSETTALTHTETTFTTIVPDRYSEYKLTVALSTPTVTIDLTTLSGWSSLSSGAHTITVKAKADGYRDSLESQGVSVTKGL